MDGPAPGGQSYVERPPVAALAGLVSSVWIQQVARPACELVDAAASPHDALAGLQRHVVGRLAGSTRPDPLVSSPTTRGRRRSADPHLRRHGAAVSVGRCRPARS